MKDTKGDLGVSLGAGAYFDCFTYPEHPESGPILNIHAGGMTFTLTNRARGAVSAGDVDNARRLLAAVSEFAADVERLHAVRQAAAESTRDAAA